MMKKFLCISICLVALVSLKAQLIFTDSIKIIKGSTYKISYAVNKSDKDTFKFVYYNNTAKVLYTETIVTMPPKTCAITGFAQVTIVTKFQATTDKAITDELTKQGVPYDTGKISTVVKK